MIELRDARNCDIPAILAIMQDVGWCQRDSYVFRTAMKKSLVNLVAEDGGRLVGFVRVLGDGFYNAIVYDLVVSQNCQRKGIGRALIDECRRRVSVPRLECISTDESVAFYRHLGWDELPAFGKSLV